MLQGDGSTLATLTDEMKDMVNRLRLCYVATVTPDNMPNLSPKGSLKVLDDSHLVFADIASPQTMANLRANPNIEINVVDPILRRGYRFKGQAEILDDPKLMEIAGEGLGAEYPVRKAVKVRVEKAAEVKSPVYMFTELDEAAVRQQWMKNYGFSDRT